MKKLLLILLALPLILTACSKQASAPAPSAKFMQICTGFVGAVKGEKVKFEKLRASKDKMNKTALRQKLEAFKADYQKNVVKPYGTWANTCFAHMKGGKFMCNQLGDYASKPACATATNGFDVKSIKG